ncbi:TPA: competence/damage-inducible protein A [Candidatus Bathyarchaeota archaeon]|nr:competence/damage-inducible protein A [Candidatus Bathyarchaeota archaeon]
MKNQVAIITIGNEILDGIILDTNTKWMIERLKPLGLIVKVVLVVRDDVPEIARAINRAIEDGCSLIITSGGLGPTHDDMTLKGVAEAFHLPLEVNAEGLAIVTRQYKGLHDSGRIESAEITEARKKMAIFPSGSRPLDNRVGGAPGVLISHSGAEIVSLPGVPHELMWIFDNQLIPHISEHIEGFYYEEVLSLPLRDESTLAPLIDEAMRRVPEVWIKSLVKPYGERGIRFWISARGDDKAELEAKVKEATRILVGLAEKRLPTS